MAIRQTALQQHDQESSAVTKRVHFHPNLIYSPGTQVVALRDVADQGHVLHPHGAVGIVVRVLMEDEPGEVSGYRIRFPDEYDRLCRELEAASEASHLPETPSSAAALNDLLLRIRLQGM
jgi:hypothetical protein